MNAQILPANEVSEVESRYYLNPQVALDESNMFIDNLRETQQANNQQIKTDTYNLGTAVPSNLGGLTGGEGYFTSRYQTPQTASAVASLRAAAQAAALNQVLENEQNKWKKRYNDAYRAYQKRANSGGNDDGLDPNFISTDSLSGANAKEDEYEKTVTVYDSTEVAHDNRSTERDKKIKVYKDNNGNVTSIVVNGVPHYGREAKARYRELLRAGLVE